MILEVIDSARRLADFEGEWCKFVDSQTGLTPFHLPGWLLTWWKHFGSGTMQVLVFRDGPQNGVCAGVVPCFLHEWNGRRQLTLMGSGISDFLDPPIDWSKLPAVLAALENHLATSADWDICDWQDLSPDSPWAALAGRFDKRVIDEEPCTEIPMTANFDAFWEQRPRQLRRNVRRYREKAEQTGLLKFEVHCAAEAGPLEALIQLHAARWQARGETGTIEANRSAEFLCDVARRFAIEDRLRLFSLSFDGKIAAVILAFLYEGKIYGYLNAFDPELERFSLGAVLLHDALRDSYERGVKAWNFCRGNEPYKFLWGAQPSPRCRIVLHHKRL